MSDLRDLLRDIADGDAEHAKDVKLLKSLLAVAELGGSEAGCGQLLLNECDQDFNKVKAWLKGMTAFTASVLLRWGIAARLTELENKGDLK